MSSASFNKLADEIRTIYTSNPVHADTEIETLLQKRFAKISEKRKLEALEKLISCFENSEHAKFDEHPKFDTQNMEHEVFSKLFFLLLGSKVQVEKQLPADLIQRLAESLTTIFEELNQLINLINQTFISENREQKTIRQIIGGYVQEGDHSTSLKNYLGQIKNAFQIINEAFKKSSHSFVNNMLDELDPEKIELPSGSLKFGPLRKAEQFDIYRNKFEKIRERFQTGALMKELFREFEHICQKLSMNIKNKEV